MLCRYYRIPVRNRRSSRYRRLYGENRQTGHEGWSGVYLLKEVVSSRLSLARVHMGNGAALLRAIYSEPSSAGQGRKNPVSCWKNTDPSSG